MKKIFIFYPIVTFLFIFFSYLSCEYNKEAENIKENKLLLNDTINANYKESLSNHENNLRITLDSVTNDSRCPKNLMCIWAGNASVRFIFSCGQTTARFELNTESSVSEKDTLLYGYRIRLLDLNPYPATSDKIEQKSYQAKIMITKE